MRSRARGCCEFLAGGGFRVTSSLGDPDPPRITRGHPLETQKSQQGTQSTITRRGLLRSVAGTVGLLGWSPGHAAGEPPPETTRLRIAQQPSICVAPQFIVAELLKAEGFTDIKYVKVTIGGITKALASGEVDISMHFVGPLVIQL